MVPLNQIQIPIGLYVGKHDKIADVEDNSRLKDVLPNVVDFHLLEEDHLSLSFSKDMTYFSKVMAKMDQFRD